MSIELQAIDIPLTLEKGLCKYCGSSQVVKAGKRKTKSGTKQQYLCKNCDHRFINPDHFPDMHTQKEIIAAALDLYFEGLSSRKVARQIKKFFHVDVDHSTILRWIQKYAPLAKAFTDELEPDVTGGQWHNDETWVKIRKKGEKHLYHYYWGIKDRVSRYFITGFMAGRHRGSKEAYKIYKDARAVAKGLPDEVYCDGCASYDKGFRKALCRRGGRVALYENTGPSTDESNNPIERHWNFVKSRTKTMRGLQRADEVMMGLATHYNYIRPHQRFGGRTPAQAAGVELPFTDGWGNLIEWSTRYKELMAPATRS